MVGCSKFEDSAGSFRSREQMRAVMKHTIATTWKHEGSVLDNVYNNTIRYDSVSQVSWCKE